MTIIEKETSTDLSLFKSRLERHLTLAPLLEAYLAPEDLEKMFMVSAVANIINARLIGPYRQIDWTKESDRDRICMILPKDIDADQAVAIAKLCGMDPYDILEAHIVDRLTELNAYD